MELQKDVNESEGELVNVSEGAGGARDGQLYVSTSLGCRTQ